MKTILVIGASGQIGTELVQALRKKYGFAFVIAADLKNNSTFQREGPFLPLDVLDKETLGVQVRKFNVGTIYLLAAMLSASGEQNPHKAWHLNMQSLLNVLEVARENRIEKVFWPSSIAVFGPDASKENCPQNIALNPETVYGISKVAGEKWCEYYFNKFGVDVRSLRYPGLISYKTKPGGGTTGYAIAIFHAALRAQTYNCYLKEDTMLPMMYMDDAVRASIELMDAPAENIRVRSSYNIASFSFTPKELSDEIEKNVFGFKTIYNPDFRQAIAESWPGSVDDSDASFDWGWEPNFNLEKTVSVMLENLKFLRPADKTIF
jgi:nucleoside-diphosphate-sugar epimerase